MSAKRWVKPETARSGMRAHPPVVDDGRHHERVMVASMESMIEVEDFEQEVIDHLKRRGYVKL